MVKKKIIMEILEDLEFNNKNFISKFVKHSKTT